MATELTKINVEAESVEMPESGLKAVLRRSRESIRSFCKEEDGLSTVEMLLLLFVGIVIIIAIMKFVFPEVWETIKNQINALLGYGNEQAGD